MNIFKKIFAYIFSGVVFIPFLVSAQNKLVTCSGADCDFGNIISTIKAIIDYLLIIASVFAAGSFMYAGFLYLFSMGNPGKISQAHEIFKKVVIGYIIMLSAWVLVAAIEKGLGVDPAKSFLTPSQPTSSPTIQTDSSALDL